jgi:hypothetical protein
MRSLLRYGALLMSLAAASAWADEPATNDDPAARIQRLEAETQALRQELERLKAQPLPAPGVQPASAVAPLGPGLANNMAAAATASVQPPGEPLSPSTGGAAESAPPQTTQLGGYTISDLREEMKKLTWSKGDFRIVPYGWLWGNMVMSTERTNPGSYTLFVPSAAKEGEFETIVDGRNTRLGFDVTGPQIGWFGCAETGGRVEVDFQQTVLTTENKPTIMLRHAYLEAKNDDFRLLVGQTWDVISPLNPDMLMYSVGWDAGNIGYRRPQVRFERYVSLSDSALLVFQGSVNEDVFSDSLTNCTGGVDGWPIVEARVATTLGNRGPGGLPVTMGVSGHIGDTMFDQSIPVLHDVLRRTWSLNLDFRAPLTDRLGFMAEAFTGENLSPFLGGIGQGIDPTTFDPIRSTGGWGEIWYDFTCRFHTHVGYSVDAPNAHDLATAGERRYNQVLWGNLVYDITKNWLAGIEVSYWKTLYVGLVPGESVRTEFVMKYGF